MLVNLVVLRSAVDELYCQYKQRYELTVGQWIEARS